MAETVPVVYPERCYVCMRPKSQCLCGRAKPFRTRMRIVILMHPKEARYQKTGTGRLARLCLENSDLFVGFDFTGDERVEALLRDPVYAPCVLYPGPTSKPFGEIAAALPSGKVPLVFVIDGTWHNAKSLLFRSANIAALPRLSFGGSYLSKFSIKHQPMQHCVSTIEAIYYLCKEAEAAGYERPGGKEEALMEMLAALVEGQQRYAREHRHRREDNQRK